MLRISQLSSIESDRDTILLLNGGGQPPFNRLHRLPRWLNRFDLNLITFELPGHGSRTLLEPLTIDEYLSAFITDFQEVTQSYRLAGVIGYSLGGLLGLKAMDTVVYENKITVLIGVPLSPSKVQEERMLYYTTTEFFSLMRWKDQLLEYHKGGWENLLATIRPMLDSTSTLFDISSNVGKLTEVHSIAGDRDDIINWGIHEDIVKSMGSVNYKIPACFHFDYFTRRWDDVRVILKNVIEKMVS